MLAAKGLAGEYVELRQQARRPGGSESRLRLKGLGSSKKSGGLPGRAWCPNTACVQGCSFWPVRKSAVVSTFAQRVGLTSL